MQITNILLQPVKNTNLRAVLASLIFYFTACTGSFRPDRDTLVVALGSAPLTLDPRYATDAAGVRIGGLIFSGFVRVGNGFKILPDAAESWTVDGRLYRFHLRPDLRFHNGREVLPEDVLYSWDFYRGPRSPYASGLKIVKDVTVVARGGRMEVTVELSHESDSFLLGELPAVKILPKAECEAAGDDFNRRLTGSGPYRFQHQKLNEIRLSSVRGKTENLVFKIVRDDFTRYQKMLKGEIDIAMNELPPEKVAEFQARPEQFTVRTYPGLNMTYILINLRDPMLRKIEVRRALAQAIDRGEIIRYKLHGLAAEAATILTPNNPYFNSAVKNPAYDPEAARRAIAALKLGSPSLTLKTANTPGAIDAGRVLANQMQRTGITVRHESYEWATYYDDVKKGNFQLATMKWVGTVDPEIYHAAFHSKETPPGRNRGGYDNPLVDRLLDQGQSEGRFGPRKRIYDQAQRLVHDELAIIPLWYDVQVAVARNEVAGFEPVMSSDYWPLSEVFKRR